ncbi:carboxymuconolactone decarboxylase family protein [Nonomuraea jiangxiensis]|uniref:Alkylhydroperoxidase AhpD family core domain-containing protein n=1 Tax=Nonomuraea jiangxiensis TaxID=633440 RepID=A0A1G9EVH4_9ACTN|nr:carboxymuconolactone decarboxylase family protein [Nonomuraea jiangxiensis]SDK80177.1 alkylhydroperoxidase AhpD family core domain-containing protein [Nonomuraea jiangxiensis]
MRMNLRTPAAEGLKAMHALEAYLDTAPVPRATLELLRLRVSQINGCGFCVDMHAREALAAGVSGQRVHAVAAWRDTAFFSDEERAALALAEAATRLSDNPDGVPDAVWNAAADHYDEESLAAILMTIVAINAWNRINVTLRNAPALRADETPAATA